MTYTEALQYISSLARFGSKPGLARIQKLMALLGNPQQQLAFVHVAGTNGKGSTTAMIASVLRKAGYKTGLYISPYVIDFRERIQVDGQMISREALAALMTRIAPLATQMEEEGDSPTEFEVLTAAALCYYRETGCDIVAFEVGLGGRCDSTNIIPPPLCAVITAIDFDHTQVLGHTLAAIAGEKCGIIKPGSAVVSYPAQPPEALAIIMEHCAVADAALHMGNAASIQPLHCGLDGSVIDYRGMRIHIPLIGAHQQLNAVTAVEALLTLRTQGYHLPDAAIVDGIAATAFPARLEVLGQAPLVLLDGAHNLAGARVLADALRLLNGRRIFAISGMLKDKDCRGALAEVAPLLTALYTVAPDNPRALAAADYAALALAHCPNVTPCQNLREAYAKVVAAAGPDDVILVWGSLYLASEFRGFWLNLCP